MYRHNIKTFYKTIDILHVLSTSLKNVDLSLFLYVFYIIIKNVLYYPGMCLEGADSLHTDADSDQTTHLTV